MRGVARVWAVPSSSYRLQITPEFTLQDAARTVPYLHRLGVDWLYLSPLLQAEQGSTHGYDVTDPSRVDAARGGPEGLAALVREARAFGMGVLVDIVPNHLGIATARANAWWWDVLAKGPASSYAAHFDIDWDFGGGRLRLPVLGDGPQELDALRVEGDELVYYEHRLPIAEGTAGGSPQEVHERQHYELVSWRRADDELNYRRFFAVSTLAGVRVEDERVFEDSHREIGRWLREGLVDGLRVDHPDGLRDPGGYLRRLSQLAEGRPIWIEKILEHEESLPEDWPVEGTTGYEALALVDRVFVDPAGQEPLTRIAGERAGGTAPEWTELARERKRVVGRTILRSEIRRVAREILTAEQSAGAGDAAGAGEAAPLSPAQLEDALVEIAAALPVYRSYLPFGLDRLDAALEAARLAAPALSAVIDRAGRVLRDREQPAAARFQQTSGMIMAKGVEDNAFYRWAPLSSLAEVGGDPSDFGVDPARFHEAQRRRLSSTPGTMTTLTTHDTKRSEDARARIAALSETPEAWERFLQRVEGAAPGLADGALEGILWQAFLGAWPASRERLEEYALKAAREAGTITTWTDPDERAESALRGLAAAATEEPAVRDALDELLAQLRDAGHSNGLGMKLLQLTAPGMPDVYQGSERWDTSLVDPDNRRAVDFDRAAELLARLDTGWLPEVDDSGAAKLLVVSRALRLRRARPELFREYRPVIASGPRAAHLIGFDRGGALALATRLPLGLAAAGGWSDTVVELGSRPLREELTGRVFSGTAPVAELFERYPVALLAVRA